MRNAGLDEAQAGIKTVMRNINNLRCADDTILMAESEKLKSLLMKVKEESEKAGLKLIIQKMKIMVSGLISSWQIDGETVETVRGFLFLLAPKSLQMVTAATKLKDTCSLEEKLWQSRQHIKKQRHYFANKGPSSQSYGFSSSDVWIWKLDFEEIWASKSWCFWTVVLEKTLENLLDCKEIQPVNPKGNQSWILTGRTDGKAEAPILWTPVAKNWLNIDSWEGVMLKLKLQYFGHLMQRTDSLEKTLMLGKTEGRRRREHQGIRWLEVINDSMETSLSKLWELLIDRGAWCAVVHG